MRARPDAVLTTEYIEGTKITDFDALAARGLDRRLLAERIVAAYCRMIFVDGVYHADPHPGNILVATDGAVAFVDFGPSALSARAMKSGAAAFVSGMIHRNATRVAEAMGTMGFVARDSRAIDVAQRVVEYAQRRFFEELDAKCLEPRRDSGGRRAPISRCSPICARSTCRFGS